MPEPGLIITGATGFLGGQLVRQLRRLGVEHEQLVFPDEVHGFLLHDNWVRAYRATADFLQRRLSPP